MASESSRTSTSKVGSETIRTSAAESRVGEVFDAMRYRPNIQARNIIIQRSSSNFGAPGVSHQVSKRESLSYGAGGMSSGSYASLSSTGVVAVKDSREREKKDLQGLNERLANYIEKVRFFEAQNRKLAEELLKLKGKWGMETSRIKAMYQAELDEARRLLDDAVKEKSRLEIRLASVEEVMEELQQRLEFALKDAADAKDKFGQQNQQLSDLEGEVGLLRRRLASLESERDKEKGLIKKLQSSLNAARSDLDNETMLHVDAENRRQTLEEELNFIKALHEQELKELQALAYRDSTAENREYWKSEMGQALREIQDAYGEKMEGMRVEMESFYNLKLQQCQTGAAQNNMQYSHYKEEGVRLRDQAKILRDKLAESESKYGQLLRELELLKKEKEDRERELEQSNFELTGRVAQLQAEMEAMLREIQVIVVAKNMLEIEIGTYRTLLEGEETRFERRGNSSQLINSMLSSESSKEITSTDMSHSSMGELNARTTFQKSAKGPIAISDSSPDGKFVALENNGRKEEELGEWSLTRSVDGKDSFSYKFPESLVLKAGEKIKVWSKGTKPSTAASGDLESDQNWGIGAHISTKLVNPAGEERATHTAQTKYN